MLNMTCHASPPPLAPFVHRILLSLSCCLYVYEFITLYIYIWEETYTFVFLGLVELEWSDYLQVHSFSLQTT